MPRGRKKAVVTSTEPGVKPELVAPKKAKWICFTMSTGEYYKLSADFAARKLLEDGCVKDSYDGLMHNPEKLARLAGEKLTWFVVWDKAIRFERSAVPDPERDWKETPKVVEFE